MQQTLQQNEAAILLLLLFFIEIILTIVFRDCDSNSPSL